MRLEEREQERIAGVLAERVLKDLVAKSLIEWDHLSKEKQNIILKDCKKIIVDVIDNEYDVVNAYRL